MSSDNKKISFFEELKRRNVYRVGVAYAVLTWLVLQVTDTITPLFSLPEIAPRLVLIVFSAAFPAVMLFAWAFELTPDGIKREKDVDRSQSITSNTGQRLDRIIMGVLVIAISMLLVDKFFLTGAPADAPAAAQIVAEEVDDTPSIAVLPFVNMSNDEDSTYFSDGLADTMLHMLAQVREIRVAARTSSFLFRDPSVDIGEIGRQLNVATVLEGSVQRAGDKVRITAQLIDVENGFHLWSGNFDRDMNDVFAIQDEIAKEVVAALKVSLLGEVAGTLDRDQTDNLDAYTEYLLGVNSLNRFTTDGFEDAVSHLKAAVEFDPEYARAWSALGRAYLDMEEYGTLRRTEAIAAARDAGSRALDLVPESSEALAILGKVELLARNRDEGGKLLSKAIENGPNDAVALTYYAEYLMQVPRPEEAITIFEKAIRLDPLSEQTLTELGNLNVMLRRIDEAERINKKIYSINPGSSNASFFEAALSQLRGEQATAITKMIESQKSDRNDPEGASTIAMLYLSVGMPLEAKQWFGRSVEIDPGHPVSQSAPLWLDYYTRDNRAASVRLARELLDNKIQDRRGSREIALRILYEYSLENDSFDSFLEVLDNLYPHLFDDPPHGFERSTMATYYVGLALHSKGETERAAEFLQAWQERTGEISEIYGFEIRSNIGMQLMLGDRVGALQSLEDFQDQLYFDLSNTNGVKFKFDPTFDPIRDEPAFVEMMAKFERNAAEQRQLLQAMNAD